MKCLCCGATGSKFVKMSRCKGKPLTIGVRCGCALAFGLEWEHAVEHCGIDLWKHTKWVSLDKAKST